MIFLIAARAKNGVIGCGGRIPWSIPDDLHHFRDLTLGRLIVMGRRTYEEIGRPLPGRQTVLISSTLRVETDTCTTVSSLAQALAYAGQRDVYIAGGERLYREALPLADVLYLTELDAEMAGDAYFPTFDHSDFVETERMHVDGAIAHDYVTYRRRTMNAAQAQAWLDDIAARRGIVLGLEPLKALLARLGKPQDCVPFVHIAGTNGKGSTAALVSSMLTAAGYRVGSYTSPAVFDPLEKWCIGSTSIHQDEFAHIFSRIRRVRDAMERAGQPVPTAFELETAAAFLYFAQNRCDIACLECGMGGAEDATNVIATTAVSVLTSIGMDHMAFLGNTLAEIARTKGGILRPGVPVVLQAQDEVVEQEIRAMCTASGCALIVAPPAQVTDWTADGLTLCYDGMDDVLVSLPGLYQARNASTAIQAVRALSDRFPVTEAHMRDGLAQAVWHGRFETISRHPRILLDGAHNPNAAHELRRTLKHLDTPLIFILGVLADKDFSEVGQLLAPLAHAIYTVTPHNPRALDAEDLAHCLRQFCPAVHAEPSIEQAVCDAIHAAGPDGTIVACGSLSYLGDVRRVVESEAQA